MKKSISAFAGKSVKIKNEANEIGGQEILIEDYWYNVSGKSWKDSNGNPAAMIYAMRTALGDIQIPLDDEVLYGKIGHLGYLVHVNELDTQN